MRTPLRSAIPLSDLTPSNVLDVRRRRKENGNLPETIA